MTAKPPLLPLFLGAETCLYIAFLYCDLTGCWAAGTALKYAAILLCLLLSLDNRSRKDGRLVSLALALTALADLFLLVLNQNYALGVALFCPVQLLSLDNRSRKDGRLVSLALALTALADLFLLVLNQNYALGVALFCPVQLIYALRLRRAAARPAPLWPRLLFSGGALAALAFTGSLTVLSGLVCLYFPQLVCNAAESLALPPGLQNRLFSAGLWLALAFTGSLTVLSGLVCLYFPQLVCNAAESLALPPGLQNRLFSAGLWLFLCCDICVGLHNLLPLLPGSFPAIAAFAQIAMWAFYLPSQVLMGLWLFLCCDICVGLHNLLPLLPGSFPAIAAFAQIAMWAFYLPSQVLIVLSASRRFPL